MADKVELDKHQFWNKLCDVSEYLHYENCKCRKCTKKIDEFKFPKITLSQL